MASAVIVLLLGCWLAGHSRASGWCEFLKPTISVSPSRVMALGENVTIRCEGRYPDMEFFLRKAGHLNQQVRMVPHGTVAEFPIPNIGWEDRGSYNCDYSSIMDLTHWSYPSNQVEIIVADPSLLRPSISLSPTGVTAPGADITIQCQGQRRDVWFFLHKAGDLNPQQHMDPAGDGAEFRIPTVGRQHGGNYSCSYQPRSEPFVSSQPSDPVQLVVAAAPPGRPDFTHANIARLVLSAVVLLVLGLILTEAYYSYPRGAPQPQEPDRGAVGLTYAELDGQPLYAKWGGGPACQEPVLYAMMNVSRGPHRQSP